MSDCEIAFISWAPHCSRSDGMARRLGGRSFLVYSPMWGSNYFTAPIKYLVQTVRTLWILLRHRPRAVLVMAPPVVACFPVWLYCLMFRARFAVDAHTGAFLDPRWRRLQFFQRFFSRRAAATIVTNEHLLSLVETWGAQVAIVPDVPVCFAQPVEADLPPGCHMTVVASFCSDEPIAELLEAARRCPEVTFHITGDFHKLDRSTMAAAPGNVRFCGFLPDRRYVGQLLACDAVIALTTRDHTMQRGAYEAIYLGKPVLTSDFDLLRTSFPEGAVHVRPTTDGIVEGIQKMRRDLQRLADEAQNLRAEKLNCWEENAAVLRELLGFTSVVPATETVPA